MINPGRSIYFSTTIQSTTKIGNWSKIIIFHTREKCASQIGQIPLSRWVPNPLSPPPCTLYNCTSVSLSQVSSLSPVSRVSPHGRRKAVRKEETLNQNLFPRTVQTLKTWRQGLIFYSRATQNLATIRQMNNYKEKFGPRRREEEPDTILHNDQ